MASPSPPQPPLPTPTPAPASNTQPLALDPPPITRPPQLEDPVRYPEAPTYPPTNKNISDALKYNHDASSSHDEDTVVEAAKYEHGILTQALAASQPEAPPWFHSAMQALKMELTKAIEHECKKGTKIMLQRLEATETRLMQNTRHLIEGLRNDLRNLKNEALGWH